MHYVLYVPLTTFDSMYNYYSTNTPQIVSRKLLFRISYFFFYFVGAVFLFVHMFVFAVFLHALMGMGGWGEGARR